MKELFATLYVIGGAAMAHAIYRKGSSVSYNTVAKVVFWPLYVEYDGKPLISWPVETACKLK